MGELRSQYTTLGRKSEIEREAGVSMVVGLVLAGSLVGAGAAALALLLGHPLWIALLLYPVVGTLSVLAAALVLVLRAVPEDGKAPASPQARIT